MKRTRRGHRILGLILLLPICGWAVETTTGVTIELDWSTLSLQQSGADTRRIDALYRVHYLQWTGIAGLDRVLGAIGLVLLVTLAILGVRLAFARNG